MTVKHNPLMIDEGTKPSWDTDEYKYFVIDEDKNTLIANVYKKEVLCPLQSKASHT